MKDHVSISRRLLLRASALAAAVGITSIMPRALKAAELPHVDESEATAVALKYKHDATASERPAADQWCYNCRYFRGTQQTAWERCDLFPGKSVAAKGWCNVWALKG